MIDERRQNPRLTLPAPLDGWFGDFAVVLLDLSATGARIEHEEEIEPGGRALLRFFWKDDEFELMAETANHDGHQRGLRFVDRSEKLEQLVNASLEELNSAYEANARGDREANVFGDETITAASRNLGTGFVTWSFSAGGWTSRRSLLPDQPDDGFTISSAEPEEQVSLLRQTYELGDEEARRMTRMLAEMSNSGG